MVVSRDLERCDKSKVPNSDQFFTYYNPQDKRYKSIFILATNIADCCSIQTFKVQNKSLLVANTVCYKFYETRGQNC